MGEEPGKGKHIGRMGALKVGQYKDGVLTPIMSVGGGFSDAHREMVWTSGTVIEVVGKARFESGALRHSNFIRVRDDKRPEDCLFPTL